MSLLDELGPPPVDHVTEFRQAWRGMVDHAVGRGWVDLRMPRAPYNVDVLVALVEGPPAGLYGGELAQVTGMAQSGVSRALRTLRSLHLVVSERERGTRQELGRNVRTYNRLTKKGARLAELARAAERT